MRSAAIFEQDFNVRTLNYLGSKLRLLDFIESKVERLTGVGDGVCDLFAGSGCVSYKLSSQFPVTACDIQYYSKVLCEALLGTHALSDEKIDSFLTGMSDQKRLRLEEIYAPLIKMEDEAIAKKDVEVLADIVEHGSLEVFRREHPTSLVSSVQKNVYADLMALGMPRNEDFISRNYGGVYFSYRQAIAIDAILSAIRQQTAKDDKTVFLAALLSTASDVVDTVGKHFAQPIKARDSAGRIKPLVYNKALCDKTADVNVLYGEWVRKYASLPHGRHSHRTIQGDYMECLKMLTDDVRTVYADPPYTREHYSRFYHVLETIARGDTPDMATVKIHGELRVSNGLYRKDRHQSPFCIRSKAPLAFSRMFKEISRAKRNLLLSYSPYDESKKTHPRVVTMRQLVSWAKDYFKDVDLVSAGKFAHNKLNSSAHRLEASEEAEMIIVCTGARG